MLLFTLFILFVLLLLVTIHATSPWSGCLSSVIELMLFSAGLLTSLRMSSDMVVVAVIEVMVVEVVVEVEEGIEATAGVVGVEEIFVVEIRVVELGASLTGGGARTEGMDGVE